MGGIKNKQTKQNKIKRQKNQIQNENVKFSLFPGSISDNYQLSGGRDGDDSGDRIPFLANCIRNDKAKIKTKYFFLFCYYSMLVFVKAAIRFRYRHKYKSLYNFQNCHGF